MFPGRRNVLLLAGSQALMLSAIVLSMSLAAILGALLAPDKSLATLPVAAMVVGTVIAWLPAALFMRRLGRRAGFLMGAGLGLAGSALAGDGLWQGSFVLFGLVAASSLSAGWLYDPYGWATLNLAVVSFLALALLVSVGTELKTPRLRERT